MRRKTTLNSSRSYSTDRGQLKASGAPYDRHNVDCATDKRPKPNGSAQSSLQVSKWSNAAHSWDDPDYSILNDRSGELPEFLSAALPGRGRPGSKGQRTEPALRRGILPSRSSASPQA